MNHVKRLHLNGTYICDYESTGNDFEDAKRVDKILADRGLKQVPTLHRAMFNQANSFASVSAEIFEKHLSNPPINGAAMSPFVVNTALAIEIFIKTLAMQHGKRLHGHEITKLFKKLPSAAKVDVEQQLNRLSGTSQWAGSITEMQHLRTVLEELDTAFVDWRYIYEDKSNALRITFQPTIFLAEILHAACVANLEKQGSVVKPAQQPKT
jgi:hypothetical protein